MWLTGLSGTTKSTIANALERELHRQGKHTYIPDGDNIRQGLNPDLGFSDADRAENIHRIAQVARLFVDAGVIVVVAFISPFQAERGAPARCLLRVTFRKCSSTCRLPLRRDATPRVCTARCAPAHCPSS